LCVSFPGLKPWAVFCSPVGRLELAQENVQTPGHFVPGYDRTVPPGLSPFLRGIKPPKYFFILAPFESVLERLTLICIVGNSQRFRGRQGEVSAL
jgi:hypothetical protein